MHVRVSKFYSYAIQVGRYDNAFEEGIQLLRMLGIHFPSKIAMTRLIWELLSVRILVSGKSHRFFLNMSALIDS
jgi:hypothetical protein